MTEDGLPAAAITRDNTHLSRPTMADLDVPKANEINCTSHLPDTVARFVKSFSSDKAYHIEVMEVTFSSLKISYCDVLAT
jgi:hypothetical protein